jgi:hypothetical protein
VPEAFNADKAMLYGRFVRAAYSMFGNDQTKLRPLPSTDFPAGYKLTAWIKMSDFFIANSDVKFYGFIAHSTTAPNQAILAIRGTGDAREWWDDSNAIGMDTFIVQNCGNVGLGFLNIYRKAEVIPCAAPQSLRPQFGSFSNQVAMFLRSYATASPSIEVAGHSLVDRI